MRTNLYRYYQYALISVSTLVGGGALALFMVFLHTGPLDLVKLNLGVGAKLAFDLCLCISFFLVHSTLIRESSRRWLEMKIKPHYYGAFFAIISGSTLFLLVILFQETEQILFLATGVPRLLFRLLFLFSIIGLSWSAFSLRSFDIVGAGQILDNMNGKPTTDMPFSVSGPYRFVRHPYLFFILMMIWSDPDITLDRLLFNCLWTSWIIVGCLLEERDLLIDFGEVYKDYQKKVPMLIPWRLHLGIMDEHIDRQMDEGTGSTDF